MSDTAIPLVVLQPQAALDHMRRLEQAVDEYATAKLIAEAREIATRAELDRTLDRLAAAGASLLEAHRVAARALAAKADSDDELARLRAQVLAGAA